MFTLRSRSFLGIRFLSTAARVRFAPSPTGQLHLGGLRTALYNYLLAKKTNGQFILRIEDTDQSRYVEGAVQTLIKSLNWAGIKPDEGPEQQGPYAPYYQSKRTELYQNHAHELIESGHAYRCFCTPERLKNVRELRQKQGNYIAYDKHCSYLSSEETQEQMNLNTPFTIRLRTPFEGTTEHQDLVYGKIDFSNKTLEDTILIKSDGYPTYHLANVVDDHFMRITHVLRGEEWLSSTPKHLLLYKAFGWKAPLFAHLPLLLNPDGSKLSKRSGDVYVEHYIDKGYLPESINNFVALLGWHPGHSVSSDDLFNMEELIQHFDIKDINNSGAIVDHPKLDWINKHHLIKRAETETGLNSLVGMLKPLVDTSYMNSLKDTAHEYRLGKEYLARVIKTIKDRIRNIRDIPELCSYYFTEPNYQSEDTLSMMKKVKAPALASFLCLQKIHVLSSIKDLVKTQEFKEHLESMEAFEASNIKKYIYDLSERQQMNPNHVMMALRYAVTGSKVGAGVAETMSTLGRDTVLSRLNKL
ncbi:glutamyl-tRNA synthetase [Sporodiniella umbellata]|nr:glutamyl-tRNA synthetase [Sporodiniella umbellata]